MCAAVSPFMRDSARPGFAYRTARPTCAPHVERLKQSLPFVLSSCHLVALSLLTGDSQSGTSL